MMQPPIFQGGGMSRPPRSEPVNGSLAISSRASLMRGDSVGYTIDRSVFEVCPPTRDRMRVWIVEPYGSIPGEAWREYRYALAGRAFAAAGHEVIWWVANFEHRYKKFRTDGTWEDRVVTPGFTVRIVPTTGYSSHVSL